MAERRVASVPVQGNPFWSQRAIGELVLQSFRPRDLPMEGEMLPVPGDDAQVLRELEGEEVESRVSPREGRGREKRRSSSREVLGPSSGRSTFRTPVSWANHGAVSGKQTAGEMPLEESEGLRSERVGPVRRSEGVFSLAAPRDDDLQREIEKEMVQTLKDENDQLRYQMAMLMKKMEERSNKSEWSEVTVESPKAKREKAHGVEALLYTPNGTQVPAGPPPVGSDEDHPPVPPWPFPEWEIYEKDGKGRPRRMEIDSVEWQLQRGLHEGGASSRHGGPGGGIYSRQDLHEGCKASGRGMTASRGVSHQGDELGTHSADRERWLLRELVQLQQALDSEKKSKVRWRADEDGHLREVLLSRAEHHGHQGQVPLCRAVHPGKGEQAPLSRASYQGRNEGDRASQSHHSDLQGDRASQLHHSDCRGDRSWQPHHGDLRNDRAWQAHKAEGGRDHPYGGEDPGMAAGSSSQQDQGGNHRTVELPELSGGDLTPLILGDWLEVVKPLMMDLSPQASRWWVLVVEESYRYYNEWRRATPMERLRISPESVVVRMDPTLHRTEQRGISLLLKAIPSSVKETVIAERLLSTTGILFTLLKNFQPGGSSERPFFSRSCLRLRWERARVKHVQQFGRGEGSTPGPRKSKQQCQIPSSC